MFSRIFSRIAGRRCGSRGSTSLPRRRPAQRLAAAAGLAMDALESRVLLSTLYVDASAPGPTYNGSSWAAAYKDLQLALSASTSGDEIRIADGTYKPTTTTTDRTISFALRDGVAIRGGYAGYGAPSPNARDIGLYPTILSGDIGTAGTNTDNSYHVVTASGVGSLAVLDGVTVTAGYANSFTSNRSYGGGLYATSSSPTLTNCIFSGNSASASGGGVYNLSASPTLTNCTFSGNSAGAGGGMANTSSSPTLANCTFSGNSAIGGGSGGYGGGLYNVSSSSPTLSNCTFSSNSAPFGGGMYNYTSSPALANCTFSRNSASGTSSAGGGMYNTSNSSPTLTNCVFSANAAVDGGGIYNSNSSPTMNNCTVSGNSASSFGGGIYNSYSLPRLTNCIVWGNANTPIFSNSGIPVVIYSDIQGGYVGVGNIDADPLFVRAPWTGPDGVFGTADDDPGDLRLRQGSPALDIGDNTVVAGVSTDLAGNPRIQNDTVDLGAYEGSAAAPAPRTLYVDLAAISGANTGVSWANAFISLQLALAAASDGDTIHIAGGTYRPTSTTDRAPGFALRNAVAVYGGYAGSAAAEPDTRNIALYPTVLSGDIGTAGTKTDNSYHVLTATGVGRLTLLDGVTVTGGNANGTGTGQSFGGGLYARVSSPVLANCTFSGSSASSGGGMYNSYSSSPTLANCTISGNTATGSGGGMYNSHSSSPTLINCTLWANSAANGGGMYTLAASPTLTNCTVSGNTASSSGGGMYNDQSSPTLTNCIVWGNSKGTIFNGTKLAVITYSIIQGGYAGVGNIDADPLFARSSWTGPDGLFGTVDDDPGNLRLREGSPALDVGDNAAVSGVGTDLAGNARIQNGTVDMGAYEGAVLPKAIYVDIAAAGGANTGASWADAFTSLASALLAASDGDTIRIADGTYRPTSGTDRTPSFALRNAVSIYGGYAGYGADDPDVRDVALYPAILSGDIGTPGSSADNSYHVLTANRVGPSTLLDGVTMTGGNANGTSVNQSGGGMYATSASPTLTNCAFNGNSATSGGGMYSHTASPALIDCTFSGNSAGSGGGMYNYYSPSSLVLTNCTFRGNSATGNGGGMYNSSSSPTLINCAFNSNVASGTSITSGGGGMLNASASPRLINCTFSGNSAIRYGGGMHNQSSSAPTLINCTVSGSWASAASGIYNASSSPTLTNCIVWGNANGAIYDVGPCTPVVTYSNIQGGYAGTGNIDADPLFVRSPWTGPDGLFGTADDDPGDLRLREGSPALDIGDNAAVADISTDLAGNARIQNGTVDLGACEGFDVSAPRVFYVDIDATGGANTGASWADAFTSLASALLAAQNEDVVHIADGIYRPTGSADRTLGFALRDAVAIYGGFAGYGAADPDARDAALYSTILSGDIGTAGSKTDNSYHVLTASGVGSSTVLDGVTVTGGNANGSGSKQSYGGGLYATGSVPMLMNCTFSSNAATVGGGMYNAFSSPTLVNCTFRGNSVTGSYQSSGGGMNNTSSSSPVLLNCTFSGNVAPAGGGIGNYYSSSPMLANCTFSGNSGGGMFNHSSSPTLINCTLSANSAGSSGGIHNFASSPMLTNCIVWGNANGSIRNEDTGAAVIIYSVIQGGYTGIGNIDAEPLFARLPWTGPDGLFGTADDDPGDLRLREGSPALNSGDNAAVSGISTDLAGNARILNGIVDMGAYEGFVLSRTLYVDVAAGGANTGISWADAFTSLASALLDACDGDTIRVADGTYRPTSSADRTLGFALRNSVAIYGGYAGFGASDPDARDIALYPTILSGDIGAAGNSADNSYHVLTANRVGPSTLLDGVTVTGGNANGTSQLYGGGMHNSSSSPTLINCTFSSNSASYGGGMANWSSSPALIHCALRGNLATDGSSGFGGGMYNNSSPPTLTNCVFSGNSATFGGGMANSGSSPTLINCAFSNNSAGSSGGGMYNYASSSPTLANCIAWGNVNGTIYNSSSTPAITHSDIEGGYAGTGNLDADPLFVRNPSPGSDGLWNGINDDYGDLRLRPGSPCIDRGNNAASGLSGIATDLAGKSRFVDIALTPDAGAGTPPIVDMGAYEAQWACPAWLDPAGVGVWDAGDYSMDIGSGVLTVAADDGNRGERLAAIRQAVALGRSTGAGIVSSAANEDRGVIAAVDGEGNILVRVALLGDVTLDERIDGDDYFAMDMTFLAGTVGWRPEADVNVDGVVDGRDYLMLDLGFLRSAAGGVQQAEVAVKQEGQQVPAGVFSVRSIAEGLLKEEEAVLA